MTEERSKVRVLTFFMSVFLIASLSVEVMAGSQWVSGKVDKIYIQDKFYGGCVVHVDNWTSTSLSCPTGWFSLDCHGDFNSKSEAVRMYDLAQLSYATSTTLQANVTDSKKHNGYCVATGVQLNK